MIDLDTTRDKDYWIAEYQRRITSLEADKARLADRVAELEQHIDGIAKENNELSDKVGELEAYRAGYIVEWNRMAHRAAELESLADRMGSGWALVEYKKLQADSRQLAEVMETLPEQLQDAFNHGICDTCAVASKLRGVQQYIKDTARRVLA